MIRTHGTLQTSEVAGAVVERRSATGAPLR